MSTNIKTNLIYATVILIILLLNSMTFSQDIRVHFHLNSNFLNQISVSINIESETKLLNKNLSFINSYADAKEMGKRITDLTLYDDKKELDYKKFASGEYVFEGKIKLIKYNVNVESLANLPANTHVSWIKKDRGLLMLNDLIPQFENDKVATTVSFTLPAKWRIFPDSQSIISKEFLRLREKHKSTGFTVTSPQFDTKNIKDTVFAIGKNWRDKEILINQTSVKFLILDEWQFTDDLVFDMTEEILKEYIELFGEIPSRKMQVILMNFPAEKAELNRWRAETRGANITILSSQTLAENIAKQRLHEQLRHEIFHLWIPNSLNLNGDYAWFYEGFAVYQALKLGVWLGQIRFDDFLNTLEQAYLLTKKRNHRTSLIESSKRRWNDDVSSVYAKGLLIAFLCDVAILERSKGKKDLKKIFREIYKKHSKTTNSKNANVSILSILREYNELTPIINKFINGQENFEWAKYLSVLGIENTGNDTYANLKLKSKLSGRQKALLKKLGYNRRRNFIRQKINRNVN